MQRRAAELNISSPRENNFSTQQKWQGNIFNTAFLLDVYLNFGRVKLIASQKLLNCTASVEQFPVVSSVGDDFWSICHNMSYLFEWNSDLYVEQIFMNQMITKNFRQMSFLLNNLSLFLTGKMICDYSTFLTSCCLWTYILYVLIYVIYILNWIKLPS